MSSTAPGHRNVSLLVDVQAINFLVGSAPLYSGYDYTGRTYFVNVNFKL